MPPLDPLTVTAAAGAVVSVVDTGLEIIGEITEAIRKVRSKALSEEDGRKVMLAAMGRLKLSSTNLDAVLADNDRRALDEASRLPEPGPAAPSAPSAPATDTGPRPTGVE